MEFHLHILVDKDRIMIELVICLRAVYGRPWTRCRRGMEAVVVEMTLELMYAIIIE